ncbi:CDP-glycerol glycerophosphotransferase family protein [Staphylococcus condimenti]|uniref:CDP-glycerol glycerophosphotransferase family protein n=2 Tax=Staphylococcus TaxID=1279 RepID=A0A143PAQ1_9STAP|nr:MULTISPECIES: teichoic acid glycerol-phosphate primase TarB [Staphylococcus]AMY05557.1 teichoic acid biosynthesis protein B [Staphylococcus condimenti]MDK8644620.1 teichoic acid glycerol-phosphate primase TarB [Staphylococcus condimenti]OFP02699.1 teichoic acid biosynthesis protein B [Staphylococcus sp. HMSC065E08]PNZ63739.1 CDP-glycerol glycerophosphotransferase family protein [Staphylococcus condimenti]QQS82640.1 CDP-glycerol glycerophosphotransferase family protein [Staphylococcus condim
MRQIIKKVYLLIISVLNSAYKKRKINSNHIVVFMTFKEDVMPIIKRLSDEGYEITVIGKPLDKLSIKHLKNVDFIDNSNKMVFAQIHVLSTAKVIFVDNYYLLMGGFHKKKGQTVIQTWHAAGALKYFGLKDHAVDLTNKKMVDQYMKVYNATDRYLVGGKPMEICFTNAFGAKPYQMLQFGLPRMLQYFSKDLEAQKVALKNEYGIEGKLAVYVPTYREHYQANREINKEKFEAALPEYTLINKLHPAALKLGETSKIDTQRLFLMADVIITDYSSLAIEASLLNKPVLFYVYDQAEYETERGLNHFYWEIPETYKAYNEEDLLHKLQEGPEYYPPLFKEWHTFSTPDTLNEISNYIRELVKK